VPADVMSVTALSTVYYFAMTGTVILGGASSFLGLGGR